MPEGNLPTIANTADRNKFHEPKPVERKPEGCKIVNAKVNFFKNTFIDKPGQTQPLQRVFLPSVSPCELSISQHRLLNLVEKGLKESSDSVEQMRWWLKQLERRNKQNQASMQQKNTQSEETSEEQRNPSKYRSLTFPNTADRNKFHEPKPVERKPEGCKIVNAKINFFENTFIDKPDQTQLLPSVSLSSVPPCELSRSQHRLLNLVEEGLKESNDSVEQMKKLLKQLERRNKQNQAPMQQKNTQPKETPEEQLNSDQYLLSNLSRSDQKSFNHRPTLDDAQQGCSYLFFNKNKEEDNGQQMASRRQLRV